MAQNYAVETVSSLPFGMLIGAPLNAAIEAQTQAAKATIDFILTVGFLPPLPPNPTAAQLADPDLPDVTVPNGVPAQNTDPSTHAGQVRMVTFSYSTTNPDPTVAPLVSLAQQAATVALSQVDGPTAVNAVTALFPTPTTEQTTIINAATAAGGPNTTSMAVATAIRALVQQTATITVPLLSVVPIPFFSIDEMTIDFVAKITEAITSSSRASNTRAMSASTQVKAGWGPVSGGLKAGMSSTHTSTSERSSKYQTELTMTIHVRASSESMPKGMAKVLDMLAGLIKN